MTSSTGRRSDSASPNADTLDALKVRERRITEIHDGALPTTDELVCGYPPRGDSVQADAMAYVDFWRQRRSDNILLADELFIASENAKVTADVENLVALRAAALQSADYCYHDLQLAERVDVLIALLGEGEATGRVMLQAVKRRARGRASDLDVIYAIAFAIGVSTTSGDGHYEAGDAAKNLKFGFRVLGNFAPVIGDLALIHSDGKGLASLVRRPPAASDDDWELETTASLDAIFGDVKEDDDDAHGVIVVPVIARQWERRRNGQRCGRACPSS
ncbi:hypothetical protein [Devosia salina]|uniref:Uncharacterized protein n=1 Tax=Devosia salina TaxID=2860336 RepID=A0ABX8WAE2_9HYPH|nr:hypothetical protein [Devosia salina]QYO75671.1 hypothetical protein K1X15_13640 [Devosia salina]